MKLTSNRLRRIIKEETVRVLREVTGGGETEKIKLKNGSVVLLSSGTKKHISAHGEPGTGSVFTGGDFVEAIVNSLSKMDVSGGGGVYVVSVPGVGYDLVLPYDEAKSLPDAQEIEVKKEERGGTVVVPGFKTSAPINKFKTDKLSIVARPSKAEFLPPDVKDDEEVKAALEGGKLFSVLSAWPGRDDVPPSSKWGKDWAVVIPDQKSGDKSATTESTGRSNDILLERWHKLAGFKKI